MANLQAGFARVDVTPPLGIEISGYFVERFASGILDALEASALALRCGDDQAILIALDNLMIDKETMHAYRAVIAERTGVKAEAVFIACSHTHTGPLVGKSELDENKYGEKEYGDYLGRKLCDCAVMAVRDMTDAKMGYAVGCAPHIAFVRRFRMKDGSIRTNPGVNNPDIVAPIGDVDERVNVLRFVRKCAPDIVIANFGVHPDVVGGDEISADFPRFVRETTEAALDNVRCMFFNGAQGRTESSAPTNAWPAMCTGFRLQSRNRVCFCRPPDSKSIGSGSLRGYHKMIQYKTHSSKTTRGEIRTIWIITSFQRWNTSAPMGRRVAHSLSNGKKRSSTRRTMTHCAS